MNHRYRGGTSLRRLAVACFVVLLASGQSLARQGAMPELPVAPQPPDTSYSLANGQNPAQQKAMPEAPVAPQPPDTSYLPVSGQNLAQQKAMPEAPVAPQPPDTSYLPVSGQNLAQQKAMPEAPVAPQPPDTSYLPVSGQTLAQQKAMPEAPVAPQWPDTSYLPVSGQNLAQQETMPQALVVLQPPIASYSLVSGQNLAQQGAMPEAPVVLQPPSASYLPVNGQNLAQQGAMPEAPVVPQPPIASYSLVSGQDLAQQNAMPVPATTPQPPAASDQEKFGVAPEDNSREFLRQESVLLKPCQWQFDIGLNYTIFDHRFTDVIVDSKGDVIPIDSLLRRRLLVMPLQVRYGLTDRIQLFAALPVGWTNTELSQSTITTPTLFADNFANGGGLGDVSAGFSYLVHKSCGCSCDPDIVATFGFAAPTSNTDLFAAIFGSPQTVLGQGVWAGFWNVLFIHTYDPVVVFYGFGSWHGFTREFDGVPVQPGDQYTYRGGVGFAVNEHITLSTMLYGYYISEARLYNQQVPGTAQEPVYLRFAVTMLQQCHRICEPFAEIGMTTDAANARFGVTWTF